MTFKDFDLIQPLTEAIDQLGYTEPTPIQQKAIPFLLEQKDLIGCAQTGTGKTAAFALPVLQNLAPTRSNHIRALILTPTRELAIQIHENFEQFGSRLPLRCTTIFGGVSKVPQLEQLRKGVDILIATPGRLCDLMNQGYISLEHIEIFVLDEADRMLDMGFIHDVKKVLRALPTKRQTLLFSATMPQEIETLANTILCNPVTVKVDPVTSTVDAIEQCVYLIDKNNKKHLLAQLLKQKGVGSAIVFTRTKHGANHVVKDLDKVGIQALAIHGNKSQTARQFALKSFKEGTIRVLIATDIAARGIDVPELSHVFNYDLPNEPETYIHRIGRTGRAGMGGIAISFCNYDELPYLKEIEKLTNQKLERKESDWPMEIFEKTVKKPRIRPQLKHRAPEGKPTGHQPARKRTQRGRRPKKGKGMSR